MSSFQSSKYQFLKWFARVAFPCWQPLLVELAVLVEVVLVELFEVLAVVANFVQVYLGVLLMFMLLRLLAGCRVRVAARALLLQ